MPDRGDDAGANLKVLASADKGARGLLGSLGASGKMRISEDVGWKAFAMGLRGEAGPRLLCELPVSNTMTISDDVGRSQRAPTRLSTSGCPSLEAWVD